MSTSSISYMVGSGEESHMIAQYPYSSIELCTVILTARKGQVTDCTTLFLAQPLNDRDRSRQHIPCGRLIVDIFCCLE